MASGKAKKPIAVKMDNVEMESGNCFWPCPPTNSANKTWRLQYAGKNVIMEHEWPKRDIPQALKFQGVVEIRNQITVHFKDVSRLYFDDAGGVVQMEVNSDIMVKKGIRKVGRVAGQPKNFMGLGTTKWLKEEEPFSKFGGNRILTFKVRKRSSAKGFNNSIAKMIQYCPEMKPLVVTTPLCAKTAIPNVVQATKPAVTQAFDHTAAKGSGAKRPLQKVTQESEEEKPEPHHHLLAGVEPSSKLLVLAHLTAGLEDNTPKKKKARDNT